MKKMVSSLMLAVVVSGCPERVTTKIIEADNPKFTALKDVATAPAKIQKASEAIFKISSVLSNGTGFFISNDGQIATNNHVLGDVENSCSREGCYIEISLNFQIGKKYQAPIKVFAQPLLADAESDFSVFQLWKNAEKKEKITSPHFLKFFEEDEAKLETVYVVGHPHGGLKKVSEGQIYKVEDIWLRLTNFILGGNSGSPILNAEGLVVGIVHHAHDKVLYLGRKDLNLSSTGTVAIHLYVLLTLKKSVDHLFSIFESHTTEEVVKNHLTYFMAATAEAVRSPDKAQVVTEVISACEKAISNKNISYEKHNDSMKVCDNITTWIDCGKERAPYTYCPVGAERDRLFRLFEKIGQRKAVFDHDELLTWSLMGWMLFEKYEEGLDWGKKRLARFLKEEKPQLTYSLADTLVRYQGAGATFRGQKVLDYILNYKKQPHYEYHYADILSAINSLLTSEHITKQKYAELVSAALQDPKITLQDWINLQGDAYKQGML